MNKKFFILKIDKETRKRLEIRQDKMQNVYKQLTGKQKKIPFTKIVSLSLQNPIYLSDKDLVKLPKRRHKL